jgi:UDP-glucuronate 4-epimerase
MKVLITGGAGFIGSHAIKKFLSEGFSVVGIDNINDYYSPQLKFDRLKSLGFGEDQIEWYKPVISTINKHSKFIRMNLEDKARLMALFEEEKFDMIINLAAQAGVRYSIENPDVYIQSNIIGFHNILEACRNHAIKHLVHASSSSVYGSRTNDGSFSENDKADSPVSLYAATKRSNELTAYSYSHLYKIPISCLRFFTVYGPWGRPDMAPMLFATAVLKGDPIKVFNNGDMERDFTYIDDIVAGIFQTATHIPENDPKYRVLNIGNGSPIKLMDFISTLESSIDKTAVKNYLPMQPGDVVRTWANQDKFISTIGYKPIVNVKQGVDQFVKWFIDYYKY